MQKQRKRNLLTLKKLLLLFILAICLFALDKTKCASSSFPSINSSNLPLMLVPHHIEHRRRPYHQLPSVSAKPINYLSYLSHPSALKASSICNRASSTQNLKDSNRGPHVAKQYATSFVDQRVWQKHRC